MEDVRLLIDRATASRGALAEKHRAFGEIVRRFQDLAFGCAYAVLGDFQLAEDAAQEAFVTAWRSLEQLRTPEAFGLAQADRADAVQPPDARQAAGYPAARCRFAPREGSPVWSTFCRTRIR